MLSQLNNVKNALLTLKTNYPEASISHFTALRKVAPYIVWAEDSEASSVEGDDHKVQQAIQGTIDLFTKTEGDALIDAIQDALITARISFYLNSVQYEDDTQYIHYEWVFTV